MARTAVGLFENSGSVDAVVRELEAGGFPAKDVRVLSEAWDMADSGLLSIPHTDFEVGLMRELSGMGAVEVDVASYIDGVRRGGVMVFATGSGERADAAVAIMNRHRATEVEELYASEPHLSSPSEDSSAASRDSAVAAGRFRSPGAGARLFVW
jgi:hypothetical protein